jgi:type II secretory pathway component GspD/PulD (secretin)
MHNVKNTQRGRRAPHPPILAAAGLATLVGIAAATASPAQAAQAHRSIWAVRWSQAHPAQAAAHQRALHHKPSGAAHNASRPHLTSTATHASRPHPALVAAHAASTQRIASAVVPLVPKIPMLAAVQAASDDVSLDFATADINDVLKALALQSRQNIVSGADVKGNITVSLSHVSLEEALDMITRLSGYQYARIGRTYVVGSQASISALTASGTAAAPATTAVITFNYSDPSDLQTTIAARFPNLKATPGKASGGQGAGGVLVVTGTPTEIEAIRGLVAQAEEALSRGIAAARTHVYNIKYAAADDLQNVLARLVPGVIVTPGPSTAFNLKAPTTADSSGTTSTTATYGSAGASGAAASAPGAVQTTKSTTYSLLLTGPDADVERALGILGQVDVRPAQINYEAKITEINRDVEKNIGVNWDFSGAKTTIGELSPADSSSTDTAGPTTHPGNIFKFGVIGRTAISNLATVSIDALYKNGDAKLLSNPNIAAIDGQPAAAFIGDTLHYISSITQTPTGQTVTTDTINVGIKLFVTGKVNNDGYITLNIHPEVSTVSGYLPVPGGGSLPQVANREANTTVRVKDGDTIAIGGLINEDDIKNVNKVPFLGDLPFFGQLFRDTKHTHHRNELVIFVKVSIMKDAA